MDKVEGKVKNDVLLSRKNESRKLLKGCFGNVLFSLVPFEIWRDIVCFADIHSILLIAQTCYAFKELVDNIGENNLNLALLLRREGQIDLAKKFLLLCSNNNNPIAIFQVGYSCSGGGGWGLERDSEKGTEWFKKSAELGNAAAMACFAEFSSYDSEVEDSEDLVDEWAQKALSSNNSFAIGFCLRHGLGTEEDYGKAFGFFEKSANEGDEFGQYWLAGCFCLGEGVKQDWKNAFYWYLKAAEQGNAESQYSVGDLYKYGLGCEKDKQRAIFWLKRSAKQGNSNSKLALEQIVVDEGNF